MAMKLKVMLFFLEENKKMGDVRRGQEETRDVGLVADGLLANARVVEDQGNYASAPTYSAQIEKGVSPVSTGLKPYGPGWACASDDSGVYYFQTQ